MKKSLFFCGVAALALASCTQSEVLEVNDSRTIGFSAFVGKPTKAVTEITKDNLTHFNVFGYHGDAATVDYNNVDVTGSKDGGYTPASVAYWVKDKNAAYEFAAYSDQNAKLDAAAFADKTLTFTNYTVDGKDLIAAQTSVAMPAEGGEYPATVDFTFYHMLSQIKFSFKTDVSESQIMKISNMKITAGKTATGTFSMSQNLPSVNWTSAQDGEYSIAEIADIANGTPNVATESEPIVILPQITDELKVTFTVTFTDAAGAAIGEGDFTASLDIDGQAASAWKPGFRYNYTATIKGSDVPVDPENPDDKAKEIKFSVTEVDGWENASDVPTEPGNVDRTE